MEESKGGEEEGLCGTGGLRPAGFARRACCFAPFELQ